MGDNQKGDSGMDWAEFAALYDARCSLEGCERPAAALGSKFCEAHERRVRRKGSPGPAALRRYTKKPR